MKRIMFLFDRLTSKFKYNTVFWFKYLRFCIQSESKKNFYRVVSNALRFNSNNMDLWELAIYYEMEIRHNPFKSRKMFMKCLRINSKSLDAWLRYLRFECRFIKVIEKRENILEEEVEKAKGRTEPKKGDFDDGAEDGFLTFDDDEGGKQLDLLASSDEEEDDKDIELGMKKSNHELLLVIVESILDDFPGDFETFSVIVKTLREESDKSLEIKLARKKIFKMIRERDATEISPRDTVKLVALNRGLFPENSGLNFEKVLKFAEEYKTVSHTTILEVLYSIRQESSLFPYKHSQEFTDLVEEVVGGLKSKELSKLQPEELKSIFGCTSGRVLASNPEILAHLESMKFKVGYLNFFLEINCSQMTFMKKLEYFEEYQRKIELELNTDLSSAKKTEIRKTLISSMVEYLQTRILEISKAASSKKMATKPNEKSKKMETESDDESSELDTDYSKNTQKNGLSSVKSSSDSLNHLKSLGPFFTQLIKSCQNRIDLLNHLGVCIEDKIVGAY